MNQYYAEMVYDEQHLEHHGIIGQKWGVTNGPPYPLGQNVCKMLGEAAASGSYKTLMSTLKSASKDPNSGYTKKDYRADKKAIKDVKRSSNPEAAAYTYATQSQIKNEREAMKKMSDEQIFEKARKAQDEANSLAMQKMYTDALAQKYSLVMETKYNTTVDSRNNYGLDKGIKSKDDLRKDTVAGNVKNAVTDKKFISDKAVKIGVSAVAAAATISLGALYAYKFKNEPDLAGNKESYGTKFKQQATKTVEKKLFGKKGYQG